jgi:hypothetical protein
MRNRTLRFLAATAILCATGSAITSAVGNGLPFVVDELEIDNTLPNVFNSNSLDFTYHSCVNFIQQGQFQEAGYFWVSSYQDVDSVVDSQINYSNGVNGYRIYAIYRYQAQFFNGPQPTPSGQRLNYVAAGQQPFVMLFVDEAQDTVLSLQGCAAVRSGGLQDDRLLGSSFVLNYGEKSQTNGIANGDWELRFGNWIFTPLGQELFTPIQPVDFDRLVINANITPLVPLEADHRSEGSGNLFWLGPVAGAVQ